MERQNRTLRFFLGCGVGGYVGATFALQYSSALWSVILGIVLGGLAAGGVFVYPDIRHWAPDAWKRATSWRPDVYVPHWKLVAETSFYYAVTFSVSWPIGLIMGALFYIGPPSEPIAGLPLAVSMLLGAVSIFPLFFLVTFVICLDDDTTSYTFKKHLEEDRRIARKMYFITFYAYYLPRGVIMGILPLLRGILAAPRGIATIGRFFGYLCRYIYSDELLLCMICGAAGATVGIHMGHAVYGAIGGIGFGVVNFEILSKRVFHLVPIRNGTDKTAS